MNLSPSVQLAQDRLREFKDQHEATMPELSKVLGVDVKKLKLLLKQKAGPNVFATIVLEKLGSSGYDNTVAALNALRNPEDKPSRTAPASAAVLKSSPAADKSESTGSSKVKAMRMLDDYKAVMKLNWNQLSLGLGYSKNFLHGLRNQYKQGKLSQANAFELAKRIEEKYAEMGLSGSPTQNMDGNQNIDHKRGLNDLYIQRQAVRALRQFKQEINGKWDDVAEALNSTGELELTAGRISAVISPSGMKAMSDERAQGIIDAVNRFDMDAWGEHMCNTPDANMQQNAPGQPLDPFRLSPSSEESSDVDQTGSTPATDQLSVEDSKVERDVYFPSGKELHDAISEAARLRLEDELGIDIDDLKAIRPQLEMLIVARRNHIPARVVIAPVEAM